MTLKCTVDGQLESPGHSIFVCHHCGKPVCEQHGWVVSADDAFDDSAEDPGRREPRPAARSARRLPQPAMHCKQCVDQHHPRAYKHNGWTDPKEGLRTGQAGMASPRPAVQPQAASQPGAQPGRGWGPPGGQPMPPPQGPQPPGQGGGRPVQQPPPPQGWGPPVQPPPPPQGPQPGQQWGRATGTP